MKIQHVCPLTLTNIPLKLRGKPGAHLEFLDFSEFCAGKCWRRENQPLWLLACRLPPPPFHLWLHTVSTRALVEMHMDAHVAMLRPNPCEGSSVVSP